MRYKMLNVTVRPIKDCTSMRARIRSNGFVIVDKTDLAPDKLGKPYGCGIPIPADVPSRIDLVCGIIGNKCNALFLERRSHQLAIIGALDRGLEIALVFLQ